MADEMMKAEWVDKYRPKTLDDYVLDKDLKEYFRNMLKNKSLQNFTMIGPPGSGKTTLAKIMCNELDAEVLFIKCATEGTIDILRSKVEPFCNAMTMDGKIKIIVLDELDASTQQSGTGSSFQMGLRTLIEAAQDDCRFICTANYQKIIPAVLSRCPLIPLKYDPKDLVLYVKKILDAEHVKYTKDSLHDFVQESFRFYPDCRKIIKHLQFCCNSGELVVKLNAICNTERENAIADAVKKACDKSLKILDVRKWYLQNKETLGDFLEGGSLLFNYVADNDLVTAEGLLKLADQLYYLNTVVDKEPIFFGMLVTISRFQKGS